MGDRISSGELDAIFCGKLFDCGSELNRMVSRLENGANATPREIAALVSCLDMVGFMSYEAIDERLNDYVNLSQPHWVDILLDWFQSSSPEHQCCSIKVRYRKSTKSAKVVEGYLYLGSLQEYLGLVLRRFPDQIYKIAPFLKDEKYRQEATLILNYMQSEEALPLLETLFEQSVEFDEQEVVDLLDAIQCIDSEKAQEAFVRLQEILADRIQASPILRQTVDCAFDWRRKPET